MSFVDKDIPEAYKWSAGVIGFVSFGGYHGSMPGSTIDSVIGYAFVGSLFGLALIYGLWWLAPKYRKISFALLVGLALLWLWITPHNYNDCVISGMKGTNNEQAARFVRMACEKKFGR